MNGTKQNRECTKLTVPHIPQLRTDAVDNVQSSEIVPDSTMTNTENNTYIALNNMDRKLARLCWGGDRAGINP